MTINDMISACDKQISIVGEKASVGFVVPGKWGKRNTKRLFPCGPVGEIVQDFGNGTIYVMFSAKELKDALKDGEQG